MRTFAMSLRAASGAPNDGVELAEDGTPKAFRIWKMGDNLTDFGVHRFTRASAQLLMASQEARGNRFSIDVDHLSLSASAPPESRKAVGWMDLEVRPDGLWACNVQWTDVVAAGLAKDPPEWRYFSPAYNTNKEGEIVQYLNTALTNNPRTWNVTALAAQPPRKGESMTYEEALAALMGDDEEKKEAAKAAIKAAFGEKEGEPPKEAPKEAAAPAVPPKEEPKAAATLPAEKKDEPKEASAVAALASMAVTLAEQGKKLAAIEAEKIAEQHAKVRAGIFAKRPDLSKPLLASLAKVPLDILEETVNAIPIAQMNKASAQFVAPTRGETQTEGGITEHRAAQLPPEERHELAVRMGTKPEGIQRPFWAAGGYRTYPSMTRDEARKYAAERKIKLAPRNPVLVPAGNINFAEQLGGKGGAA